MQIVLYLNTLDEDYQLSIYKSIKTRCNEMGIDLLCIQQEHISPLLSQNEGFFPSRNFIHPDGVLILTPAITEFLPSDSAMRFHSIFDGIPVVSIGDNVDRVPSIIIRSRTPMEQLMAHLIFDHQYRKFVYISGPKNHRDNILRETIFRTTLEKARAVYPDIDFTIMAGTFIESSGTECLNAYYQNHRDEPPDVVVCANDEMAIGALKVIKSSTKANWQHVAITGFDDTGRAQMSMPPLTTIKQPFEEMGQLAVEKLYALIKRRPVEPCSKMDSTLTIRSSCGCSGWERKGLSEAEIHAAMKHAQFQTVRLTCIIRDTSYFGQKLNTISDFWEIEPLLKFFLGNLEINFFYLLLFEKPGEYMAEDAWIGYEKTPEKEQALFGNPVKVNLNEFFAQTVMKTSNSTFCRDLRYLRAGNDIFGLILYESDVTNHPYMCTGTSFIANALQRLRLMDLQKRHALQLEKEVALRTADLVEANKKIKSESQKRIEVEAEVLKISELERMRFSMDLHDDICQRLAGLSMKCRGLAATDPTEEGRAKFAVLSGQIEETLQRTRQYAHDSFPMEVDSLGMNHAVDNLCHTFSKQTGLECKYFWDAEKAEDLPQTTQIALFRIIQEALQNIVKHAKATECLVSITEENKHIVVTVHDNGRGIKQAEKAGSGRKTKGLGMKSMEYRADQIDAQYKLTSSSKTGTKITITLPLNQKKDQVSEKLKK